MPDLGNFESTDFAKLLASDKVDASNGILMDDGTKLQPDTRKRTILIGIGGSGVKTINYVKGVVKKRMMANWVQYIAFLGIDSDNTEFDKSCNLEGHEQIVITRRGATERYQNRGTYPRAAHFFMPDGSPSRDDAYPIGDLNQDGANQQRLVGKAKIHDLPGGIGVDQEIVNRITQLAGGGIPGVTPLAPMLANSTYEVYVIGSTCGGTCSGSFLEMPSLIRKALTGAPANIYAMLFLPDTLAGSVPPQTVANLKANGYASLKELNYFQGMEMRRGYVESWSYNDPANPMLTQKDNVPFFSIPYLIGVPHGATAGADKKARSVIAEFLLSILAKINTTNDTDAFLTDAFLANAGTRASWIARPTDDMIPTEEKMNTYHDFPKAYAAIGFAKATPAKEVVRAFQINTVCKASGIKSVSAEEHARIVAAAEDETTIIPFRGKDDLMNATVGTAKAREIMQAFDQLPTLVHSAQFSFMTDMNHPGVTFQEIKQNGFGDAGTESMRRRAVELKTSMDAMNALTNGLRNMYAEYRRRVQSFVKAEGPHAFVNLFKGHFTPVAGNFGMGLEVMFKNLAVGKKPLGESFNWMNRIAAEQAMANAKQVIASTQTGMIYDKLHAREQMQARDQWIAAYDNLQKAIINEARHSYVFDRGGVFSEQIMTPACLLTDQIESFGDLLDALGDVYSKHGQKMDNFSSFAQASDTATDVNLTAVNSTSYQWLRHEAESAVESVNARQMRDKIIDHFFGSDASGKNSDKWLLVPDNLVSQNGAGSVELKTGEPIPARAMFDELVAESIPAPLTVSVQDVFEALHAQGQSYNDIASEIVSQLVAKSAPQVNANLTDCVMNQYIMYPSNLGTGEHGAEIVNALRAAASTMIPGVGFYDSVVADGIMMYQMATNMPVYELRELEEWENQYEVKLRNPGTNLHGKAPNTVQVLDPVSHKLTFEETIPWKDYPSIVGRRKPEQRDAFGNITREGELRQKVNDTVELAKRLGVLFSQRDAAGNYGIYRVFCDGKTNDWLFNPMEVQSNNALGTLPEGKALVAVVAEQNGRSIDINSPTTMTRLVKLENAGQLSKGYPNEAVAWDYAKRVLRVHIPMYIEVMKSIQRFEEWNRIVKEYNEKILARFRPARFVYLLKSGLLTRKDTGVWVLKDASGSEKVVVNLSDAMKEFLLPADKRLVSNGFVDYLLFNKVDLILPGDALEKRVELAKQTIDTMLMQQDIASLQAGNAAVAAFEAERTRLVELGARVDGSDLVMLPSYVEAMQKSGFTKEEAKAMDTFYYRASMWESV